MSVALLDVNVLLALCDPTHADHAAAETWFIRRHLQGWATCAITENGFLRIAANPAYSNPVPSLEEARIHLSALTGLPAHEHWNCDVSLLERTLVRDLSVVSSGQLTDVYLLALAVSRGGAKAVDLVSRTPKS